MRIVTTGHHPGRASTFFMLMINLKSTDPVYFLSTMNFLAIQFSQHNMVPILTFNQPLYSKSISTNEHQDESSTHKKIVLRIGGFHQMMSFTGSIGYIMQGHELQTLFELIYAVGSINAVLCSKEISRVTQAQLLILTAKLFKCNVGEPCNDGTFTINSSLPTLKELVKGTHKDTTPCTMQIHIITILLDKLLVLSNATTSKIIILWV